LCARRRRTQQKIIETLDLRNARLKEFLQQTPKGFWGKFVLFLDKISEKWDICFLKDYLKMVEKKQKEFEAVVSADKEEKSVQIEKQGCDFMAAKKTVMKYQNSRGEISEREISDVHSTINGKSRQIYAFCHLREEMRGFNLENIIELNMDGKIIKDENALSKFWIDNIRDKKAFAADCEAIIDRKTEEIVKKEKELEEIEKFVADVLKQIS